MRVSVGNGVTSIAMRRALASCGTRQISASVGASPWQKAPGRRVAREARFERFQPDVDPVLVPRVLLFVGRAERVLEVLEDAQVVERVDVAGDRQRDARALGRARRASPGGAAARGAFSSRYSMIASDWVSTSPSSVTSTGTRPCGFNARYSPPRCMFLRRWTNSREGARPFRFSAMRTR